MEAATDTRFTPAAIALVLVLLIPGLLVGAIPAWLYRVMVIPEFEGGIFNWISSGWFYAVVSNILPNFLHGCVGGWFAGWACRKLIHRANYEIVRYAASSVIVALAAFILLYALSSHGLTLMIVSSVLQVLGIIACLFVELGNSKGLSGRL